MEPTHQKKLAESARQALASQDAIKDNDRSLKEADIEADSNEDLPPAELGKRKRSALHEPTTPSYSGGASNNSHNAQHDSEGDSDQEPCVEVIAVEDSSGGDSSGDGSSDGDSFNGDGSVEAGSDKAGSDKDGANENGSSEDDVEGGSTGNSKSENEGESEDSNAPQPPQGAGPARRTPLPVAPSRRIPGGSRYELIDPDLDPRIRPGMNVLDLNRSLMPSIGSGTRLPSSSTVEGGNHAGFTMNSGNAGAGVVARTSRKPPQAWSKAETERLLDLQNKKTPWPEIVKAFPGRERKDLQKKIARERAKLKKAKTAAAGSKGKAPATEDQIDEDEEELEGDIVDDADDELDDEVHEA